MKIGIDCRLWNETGVGRYTRNLVLELSKLDKKNDYVLFVLPRDEGDVKIAVSNSKFDVRTVTIKWHTLKEQLKFPNILNKEELDLVHFPYFSVPILYKRPFVVTIHDLIINHFSTGHATTLPPFIYGLKLAAYKFVLNQAAKNAKKIIAVSNATKEEIIDHLKISNNKIIVTHEGVDEEIINSKLEIPNKFQKTKYFLYVGNAYPHKNLYKLLGAFKTLNAEANLVFIEKDDSFYRRLKRKIMEMNLFGSIMFERGVTDDKLSALYRNALALVMPSLMEGFGLPALEAMSAGCLVLASDIPSLREICDDAAIYFNPYDTKDIAQKMKDIVLGKVKNFNEIKRKGLMQAKKFSWKKMAKETLKTYESSLSI